MPGESKSRVFRSHAAAVVGDPDIGHPAAADLADNVLRSGIKGVFQQLLDYGRRALHHLTGGNQIRHMGGEYVDYRHNRITSILSEYFKSLFRKLHYTLFVLKKPQISVKLTQIKSKKKPADKTADGRCAGQGKDSEPTMYKRQTIDSSEIKRQEEICGEIAALLRTADRPRLAMVDTYGCQQNEADSEKIRGYLGEMGYGFTQNEFEADLIVVNTCAVREHAEQRVLGNVGALNHTKKARPGQIIAVCGCMVQQEHMAQKIKLSYPIVDLVFGPHELWRFPELLQEVLLRHKRIFAVEKSDGAVAEGIPLRRDGRVKAWLSVMYGCNNFCSYCIVPYVRGRERSRLPEDILKEAKELVAAGYKDITLLGQNVNSYGKDLESGTDFADLLRMVNDIPGEFLIRFMTSHPKDATEKLFKTMAECEKCAHQLHLPVQSGNDRILKVMNRHYDRAAYIRQVELARRYMPDLVLTTDIIVGFPGETEEEFGDTISLCEEVRYDAMFTFIYSRRQGTPAAVMEDPYTREQKQVHFDRLTEVANRISGEKHREYIGTEQKVLVDGETGRDEYNLSSRTNGGRLVHLKGSPELIGQYITVRIKDGNTWALYGELPE